MQPPKQKWQTKPARIVYSLMTDWGGGGVGGGFGSIVALLAILPFYKNLSTKEVSIIFLVVALTTSLVLRGLAIHYGFDTRTWKQILRTFVIETCIVSAILYVLYRAHVFSALGLG